MSTAAGRERPHSRFFARNSDLTNLFDAFLIAAITTILVNRVILFILDYPQIGGRGLHIAHVLWGGLLMALSLLGQVMFLGRRRRWPLAVVGGIGFGLFVDELGKFVTSTNDYFYRPTAALVYIVFVLLYLGVRHMERRGALTPEENLANVLDTLQDGALRDIDEVELKCAYAMLNAAGPSPWSQPVRSLLDAVRDLPPRGRSRLSWLTEKLRTWYAQLASTSALQRLTLGVFGLHAVLSLAQVVVILLTVENAWHGPERDAALETFALDKTGTPFIAWLSILSSLAVGVLVLIGFWRWRTSRLAGYRMFERSLLLSIFVVQPLTFYEWSFVAVITLFFDLLLLACVQYALSIERANAEPVTGGLEPSVEASS